MRHVPGTRKTLRQGWETASTGKRVAIVVGMFWMTPVLLFLGLLFLFFYPAVAAGGWLMGDDND